jgi:hypothetical protein
VAVRGHTAFVAFFPCPLARASRLLSTSEAVLGSPAECQAWDYVGASDCRAQLVAGKPNHFSVVDHVLRVTNAPQPPRHPIYHTPQGEARGVSKDISESYRDGQKTVCLFTIAENKRHVFQA